MYNFDEKISRIGFNATKWDEMELHYTTNDLIPLWVADMDFKTAPAILEAIKRQAEHGIYGYMTRKDSYFKSIVTWFEDRHDFKLKEEWLVFSPGVMCSMNFLIEALTKANDKILIQQPVYYPFMNKIIENGRKVLVNELVKQSDYTYAMDFEKFEEQIINEKPPLFILCNPHNPVGRVWTKEELTRLGDICLKHGVKVISDEIHCDLVYKPYKHIPFASISDAFAQNSVTLTAPSKTFNLAGLQTSFAICPNESDKKILSFAMEKIDLKRNNSFSLVATEAAYQEGARWLDELLVYLDHNLNYVVSFIKEYLPQLNVVKPQGTYLLWIDFSAYGLKDEAIQEILIKNAGVALTKGANFGKGGQGHFRMNVACPIATLEIAMEKIKKALSTLQ
jgi:cystathionine beta-lyase